MKIKIIKKKIKIIKETAINLVLNIFTNVI